MKLPVFFRRLARNEFEDALEWYEKQKPGLGAAFRIAVEHALEKIAEQPTIKPKVFHNLRESLVPGFPYCVYYLIEPGRLVIVAIFHTARDPSIWQGRT